MREEIRNQEDGSRAKPGKNKKIFCYPTHIKNGAQTPRADTSNSWADFAVIGFQLYSTITAIFLFVALS